jgi:hypothetical protein
LKSQIVTASWTSGRLKKIKPFLAFFEQRRAFIICRAMGHPE